MEVETRSTGAPNGSSGNREPRRAVRAGRRPPAGEALRARSVVLHIMGGEASKCWRVTRSPGCRSSLRPNCDMEWFGRNLVDSIRSSVSPQSGDHEPRRARTGLRPFRVSPRLGQATDLAVTQAVVDL